ncbi:MAG: DUF2828 family protein [Candidatus Hermodarchaeota archaeon]
MKEKNKFLDALEEEANYTRTENYALTYKSTKSSLLDFFALGGALRSRNKSGILSLFTRAFNEDSLLAFKCLYYFRDIRGGQGERRTFRVILEYLGNSYPNLVSKNISSIPEFGRWDDLYSLINTRSEKTMLDFIRSQLYIDIESETPSLLAKWLKSENTSSPKSKILARKTRDACGLTNKEYRTILSQLRTKLDVIEKKMCDNLWDTIVYSTVPSRAGLIYSKAFRRHDEARYEQYLNDVENKIQKINVGTLYPYDILRKIVRDPSTVKEADIMWENQKDWLQGSEEKAIVVCDTSGSMYRSYISRKSVEPILVSVSLSLYFAERNVGVFHNKFITFSNKPELQTIVGKNLLEKWNSLKKAAWGMNTDLQAVFDLILKAAVKHSVPKEDMLDKIYIISDMEFDQCILFNSRKIVDTTNIKGIKMKYKKAGYEKPRLVFWNVESRKDNVPIKKDERGVVLVSGCSPSIFEYLMKGREEFSPIDLMLDVLNSPRYDNITL